MTLDELEELEIEETENVSYGIWVELMNNTQPGWTAYGPGNVVGFDSLCRRFVNSHALVPGPYAKYMYGIKPSTVFGLSDPERTVEIKGALYSNGAVVRIYLPEDGERYYLLWVDEETRNLWRYPEPKEM